MAYNFVLFVVPILFSFPFFDYFAVSIALITCITLLKNKAPYTKVEKLIILLLFACGLFHIAAQMFFIAPIRFDFILPFLTIGPTLIAKRYKREFHQAILICYVLSISIIFTLIILGLSPTDKIFYGNQNRLFIIVLYQFCTLLALNNKFARHSLSIIVFGIIGYWSQGRANLILTLATIMYATYRRPFPYFLKQFSLIFCITLLSPYFINLVNVSIHSFNQERNISLEEKFSLIIKNNNLSYAKRHGIETARIDFYKDYLQSIGLSEFFLGADNKISSFMENYSKGDYKVQHYNHHSSVIRTHREYGLPGIILFLYVLFGANVFSRSYLRYSIPILLIITRGLTDEFLFHTYESYILYALCLINFEKDRASNFLIEKRNIEGQRETEFAM